METVYLLLIILLFILAASDLVVGVANDAVNFLNSAIGAKVAPLRIILIVAAAGVLVGATFSGGMMEVARKGIFNPAVFSFENVLIICLAVMLTDVILLDLFNTFGLPTSTTVSLVFELIGATVAMSIIRMKLAGEDLSQMGNYLNAGKALVMISGILLSVVLAFSVGSAVQYVSRIIFSFNYKKTMRYFGAIWGGIAITSIVYFILIKGAKGASFMTTENVEWIHAHTFLILLGSFIFWSLILQLLHWLFKLNILKFIVFAGTFALALAFAGNDLVNFIGVPLAGYDSYRIFSAAEGADPRSFLMSGLLDDVKTPTVFLLIAGIIMVMTLWLSRKARSVIKTSLNLSDQRAVDERFQSSVFARSLVRQAISVSKFFNFLIPGALRKKIEKRFDPKPLKEYMKQNPGVSFDLIRASVNLVVSSILIAFGTSMKLPLSTTYVTFMVAMGTSLADGAWGRESAVYRISGVITVIGGWFFTAISAFTVALLLALFIYYTSFYGLIAIIPLAVFLLIKTQIMHNKKEKADTLEKDKIALSSLDGESIYETCSENISSLLEMTAISVSRSIDALIKEKRKKLRDESKTVKNLNKASKALKKEIPHTLARLSEESFESGHSYIEIIEYLREAMHCASFIINPSYEHVDNNHSPLSSAQIEGIREADKAFLEYVREVNTAIGSSDYKSSDHLIKKVDEVTEIITKIRKKHLKLIQKEPGSTRTNMLYLDILSEMKNMTLHINNIYKAFRDFSQSRQSLNLMNF
jgi:phosphate/sulfate permease